MKCFAQSGFLLVAAVMGFVPMVAAQDTSAQESQRKIEKRSLTPAEAIVTESYGPTRSAYEINVAYNAPGDNVFYAVVPCTADDYRIEVNWGDTANFEPLVAYDNPAFPTPDGSTLHYASKHAYSAAGAYKLTVNRILHCTNTFATVTETKNFSVTAYPRTNMLAVDPSQAYPYRSGREIDYRIVINAQAPPSGTRVYLEIDPNTKYIDPKYPVAQHLDIPPGETLARGSFRLILSVPAATKIFLKATAGTSISTPLNIAP
jgi:hypothetical protein